MLPTTHLPVLRPMPILIRMKACRPPRLPAALLFSSSRRSIMSSAASQALSDVVVVERRVPERHDGVAHIFVDRALARR